MIRNPFPGPKPYRASDRAHFFGRDEVSYRLSRLVLASRCVTVHGPSGAGKSSLLQASVLPGLVESHDARVVRVDGWPEQDTPTRWLSQAMHAALGLGAAPDDRAPHLAVLSAAQRAERGSSRRMIIYLDQLEQLLYAGRSPEETEPFFDCLNELAALPLRAAHIVLSLREDYLGRFRDRLRDRQRVLGQGFRVGPLTVAELTSAVCSAAAVGEPPQTWSDAEMRALMREVRAPGTADSDDAEAQSAFAQIVCRALFQEQAEREQEPAERAAPSRRAIPAEAIVRGYFETTLADLGPLRSSAERLLEDHLVTADGSRTLRTEKELSSLLPRGELAPILEALERAAILSAEEHQGSRYFELGHDWLARRVVEARKAREARKEEARREEERRRALEEERAIAEARLAKARAARRRLLVLACCALAFAGVTSVLGVIASVEKRSAVAAQQRAEDERVEAQLESLEAHDQKVLAGFAVLSGRGELAWGMKLLSEVRLPALRQGWVSYASDALQTNVLRVSLRGHASSLTTASFAPDGAHLLTASTDGTARVWKRDGTGQPVILRGHAAAIHFAAWSPDGQRVLTLSEDTTARIFRADGSGEPVVLRGASGALVHGGFSPDGERVVTASMDGKARVYGADGGKMVALEGHEAPLTQARFLPDGARIVTASDDGTARVWDGRDDFRSVTLSGHRRSVIFVTATSDGSRIVTASLDQTARVFSSDGKGAPVVLEGHNGPVLHAATSPDGTRVATASADGSARIFRIDGAGKPVLLFGHTRAVTHVEFRPDGRFLATASADETARVWPIGGEVESIPLRGHAAPLREIQWSPDGSELITAAADRSERSVDRSAKVWRMPSFEAVQRDASNCAYLHSASVDAEGERFVEACDGNTARLLRIDGRAVPVVFKGHEGWVASASLSLKGDRVVTASFDETARVWSADGRGEPVILRGHEAAVRRASFSPDGARVVTASEDRTARVFAVDGKGEPVVLRGHDDWLTSASFSPDGARVVTASMDHTARVYRADGSGEPVVLSGHGAPVVDAVFDPSGERVVTVSDDGTARVFRADGAGESILLGVPSEPVLRAAWSRDGKRVVLASVNGLIRVWSADGTGQPVWLLSNFLPLAVSFVDNDQAVLAVAANGRAHTWTLDVETLRRSLDASSADCVPAWVRILTLGEPTADAELAYWRCESRYGRLPAPAVAPRRSEAIDPAVLERAAAGRSGGGGSAASRSLVPALPLLKDMRPTARRVKVIVLPTSAGVNVDGIAARRRDGVIEIEGKVGSVHRLRVAQGEARIEQDVTIGDDAASPDLIDLRPTIAARPAAHQESAPGFDPMVFAGEAPYGIEGSMPTVWSPR